MSAPQLTYPFLPPNTIVPDPVDQKDLFIQYFNRLYEDIASAINQKDFNFFTIGISDKPLNIPYMGTFGAFVICVSGTEESLPVGIWTLTKANANVAGTVTDTQVEKGSGIWDPFKLKITSTATNYQIQHNKPNTIASFNIRIIGTQ